MFEWDEHNLRKIQAHRVGRDEVEQALSNDPVLVYDQTVGSEVRYVYYGESYTGRLLALVATERNGKIRVITAYDLDAGQKREYLTRRLEDH